MIDEIIPDGDTLIRLSSMYYLRTPNGIPVGCTVDKVTKECPPASEEAIQKGCRCKDSNDRHLYITVDGNYLIGNKCLFHGANPRYQYQQDLEYRCYEEYKSKGLRECCCFRYIGIPCTLHHRKLDISEKFPMTERGKAVKEFPPGSDKAVEAGCLCPTSDNHFGKGATGSGEIFWFNGDCPVHVINFTEEVKNNPEVDKVIAQMQKELDEKIKKIDDEDKE